MRLQKGFLAVVAAFLAMALLPSALMAQPPQGSPGRIALRAARLVDGKSDTVRRDAVVMIEGERIAAVGGAELLAPGLEVIDLGDATLLPGLVDAHSHPLIVGD